MKKHIPFIFLAEHPAHIFSCGFGVGCLSKAPGTWGTLLAWILYPLLRGLFPNDLSFFIVTAVLFLAGIYCCHQTGKALNQPDHSGIVLDEMVAFWFLLLMTPSGFIWEALAFGLFRLFDIAKPGFIRTVDRKFKNGFGVMIDDIAATLIPILLLQTADWLLFNLFGL